MNGMTAAKFNGETLPMYQSETDDAAHVITEGSFRKNLEIALELYERDREEFFITNPSDSIIIDINARCMESAKELVAVAESLIRYPEASAEDKVYALKVIRFVNNDAASRRDTLMRAMNAAIKKDPDNQTLRLRKRSVLLACVHSCQCISNSLSSYETRVASGAEFENPLEKLETKASLIARRIRGAVPEGKTYRPAMIYPKRVSPPGERVQEYPEAMNRFLAVPIEEKEFDPVSEEFVLPEGYISEDGKLTDQSVVWHPETHEVEMGLVGEEKEIWNYRKITDDSEVFLPGEWFSDYQIRLFQQKTAELNLDDLLKMLQ